MLFNSTAFVVFLVGVFALYFGPPLSWRSKKLILLIASYVFYAAWNPYFVLLLWLSTIVDWFTARGMAASTERFRKRCFLAVSLTVNLGVLGGFKYANFLLDNFNSLASVVGWSVQTPEHFSIVLPVGISFYTFQTMSYSLDVYRGHIKKADSFLDYALYVTFFPQLVAGPIVRVGHFLGQCVEPKHVSLQQFSWGLFLATLGVFQKIVLADNIMAPTAEVVFDPELLGTFTASSAWLGAMAFTAQLFFDFSGYSTCAIGVAVCLGFRLPKNFNAPFASVGFADFWSRMHISLSSWLKDYVFFSLGGARRGVALGLRNVLITFFLGGLWHGAAWTFVAWGLLHGTFLAIEHPIRARFRGSNIARNLFVTLFLIVLTQALICMVNVFFRASEFGLAYEILKSMWGLTGDDFVMLSFAHFPRVLSVYFVLLVVHFFLRDCSLPSLFQRLPSGVVAVIWTAMIFMIVIFRGRSDAFIYFQF